MSRSIKKIRLMNFQVHKSLVLDDISDGMVALVGQSSSGKTSVLRAIKFCLYNQMPGNSLPATITHDETHCEVEITFDDGLNILRVRDSKTKDNYYVITKEGEETRLDTPGVGPVKEVILAHGMRPVSFLTGKDILNYGSQHDLPFFINASPQERMKAVGVLSNTEVVDAGVKIAASNIRENKRVATELRKTLSEKNARLKEIGPLTLRKKKLEKARTLISSIIDNEAKKESLKTFSLKLQDIEDKDSRLSKILDNETSQKNAEFILNKLTDSMEKLNNLQKIKVNLERIQKSLSEIDDILKKAPEEEDIKVMIDIISRVSGQISNASNLQKYLSTFERINLTLKTSEEIILLSESLEEAEKLFESLDESISKIQKIKSRKDSIDIAKESFSSNESFIERSEKDYDKIVDDFINAFSSVGVCPLCESKITKESEEKIKNEYKI